MPGPRTFELSTPELERLVVQAVDTDGRASADAPLERAVATVVGARRVLTAVVTSAGVAQGDVYFVDGATTVAAEVTDDRAELTEAFPTERVVGALADEIRSPGAPTQPDAIIIPATFVLGVGEAGMADEPPTMPELAARLRDVYQDDELARLVPPALVEAELLTEADGRLHVHPAFAPWHDRIASGERLDLGFFEVPGREDGIPVLCTFPGPRGDRCVVVAAGDGTDNTVFAIPTREEIEAFLTAMLAGATDPFAEARAAWIATAATYVSAQ